MALDRLIHNGMVLTVNPHFEIIHDGVVGIKDGVIQCVEPRSKDIFQYHARDAKDVVDAGGGIVMPGLINAHVHLPMSIFRGLADDLPLAKWLNDYIFPAEQKNISPRTVLTGTLLSCAEMMMSGTTCCCDGYFFEHEVAEAVRQTGLRAILAQGVIDFPAPGVPDPSKNVETAVTFVKEWKNRSSLVTPSIFCHSAYTCSTSTLTNAKQKADEMGVLFQIHVAETADEVRQIRKSYGMSPVQYLDASGILDENTLISHAVWIDEQDMEILAAKKVRVVHNPESNMKLASGIAPIPEMIEKGITVGLGTDGCASNNNLDLFGEMDSAAKLHKVCKNDPTIMDAKTVIRMATINSAAAIGMEDSIGSLETGKQADIIVIDTQKPHLTPMYHPESHVVYAASGSDVSDVFVGGRALVRHYRPVHLDMARIVQEAILAGLMIKQDQQRKNHP